MLAERRIAFSNPHRFIRLTQDSMLTTWVPVSWLFDLESQYLPNAYGAYDMADREHEVANNSYDPSLGAPRSSTLPKVWHLPSCPCRYETRHALQQPMPAHLDREQLPKYQSLPSPTLPLIPEKLRQMLPKKKHGRFMRNLRWTWLSVYHRLNLLVLLPNILAMVILGAKHSLLSLSPASMSLAVAVNVIAAVLIRQELVINFLFVLIGSTPHWIPLRIRRILAKIYHLGGVHSGAGIAATVWYTLLNTVVLKGYLKNNVAGLHNELAITVTTFIIDILFISIIVFAHPKLRNKFHNTFEAVHRFAGWSAVGLFWAQFFLIAEVQQKAQVPTPAFSSVVYHSPILYLLLIITLSLILPWLRLRKVAVVPEKLSNHAIRLHFTYCNLPLCAAPRISDSPLTEWHAFAGIPEDDGSGFSVIVSKAGDWTARIIREEPKFLWVRGIPERGVLHVAPIFRSMVLVATGSGIGPVLSLLTARNVACRILWSTQDPQKTYGRRVVADVLLADPDAVIINTSTQKRPDLVQEAHSLYTSSGAEAIFVISNPKVTRKVVFGLESRGLPTFAPIFDS